MVAIQVHVPAPLAARSPVETLKINRVPLKINMSPEVSREENDRETELRREVLRPKTPRSKHHQRTKVKTCEGRDIYFLQISIPPGVSVSLCK